MILKNGMTIDQFLNLFEIECYDAAEVIDWFDNESFDLLEDDKETFERGHWNSLVIDAIADNGCAVKLFGVRMK